MEFESIYLHGLVLARKSTCVSKNDNHEAQHRICQRICLNGFVLPCLQPPLCSGDVEIAQDVSRFQSHGIDSTKYLHELDNMQDANISKI